MSLTLIGTPCNGPLSSPVLVNSASSLRASSLAPSKNTEQRRKRELEKNNDGNRSRTLRQTIRCLLRLSSARQVRLQHGCSSPHSSLNILHDLFRYRKK